jgi:hypothetical protein
MLFWVSPWCDETELVESVSFFPGKPLAGNWFSRPYSLKVLAMKNTFIPTLFAGFTLFSCLHAAPIQAQNTLHPVEMEVPVQGGIVVGSPGGNKPTYRLHEREFNNPVASQTLENQANGPFLPPVDSLIFEEIKYGIFIKPLAPITRLASGSNETQYDSSAEAGPGISEFLEAIVYGVIPMDFWRWDPDEFDGIDDDIVGQLNPGSDSNNGSRDD